MDKQSLLTKIIYLSDDIREYSVLSLQNCVILKQYIYIFDLDASEKTRNQLKCFEDIFTQIKKSTKDLISNSGQYKNEEYLSVAKVLYKKNNDAFTDANLKFISFLVNISEKKEFSSLASFLNHIIFEQQVFLKKAYANK